MGGYISIPLARVDDKNTMIVLSTPEGSIPPIAFSDKMFNAGMDIFANWGNNCVEFVCPELLPGTIVRDLGRRANFYDENNTLISTFRQIQLISGAGSEGVDGATSVEPWRVGWMLTYISSPTIFPLSDNYARSVGDEKPTQAEILEKIRAFLEANKGRIKMVKA